MGLGDEVRVAVAAAALLGESPVWHPGEGALYYCDIPGRALHRFDPRTGSLRHWNFETEVASLAPRLDGALLLAMRDGLWRFAPASGERKRLIEPPYDPSKERFNDGKCDPQGRFWVGTIYEPRDPALASVHCYTDGKLVRKVDGLTVSNGLAWSPNGRTMYWSDTKSHTIFAADFDPANGDLSRKRVFASFPTRRPGEVLADYGGRPDVRGGAAVAAVARRRGGFRASPPGAVPDHALFRRTRHEDALHHDRAPEPARGRTAGAAHGRLRALGRRRRARTAGELRRLINAADRRLGALSSPGVALGCADGSGFPRIIPRLCCKQLLPHHD
jgi:SMP-30/Gluconolactonase/LRE-like region